MQLSFTVHFDITILHRRALQFSTNYFRLDILKKVALGTDFGLLIDLHGCYILKD